MALLWATNNATINAHVKTQNPVKHRVWHIDPWPGTWTGQNRWPGCQVTRDPLDAIPSFMYIVMKFWSYVDWESTTEELF